MKTKRMTNLELKLAPFFLLVFIVFGCFTFVLGTFVYMLSSGFGAFLGFSMVISGFSLILLVAKKFWELE